MLSTVAYLLSALTWSNRWRY